jgi:hypothetical protein
MEMAWPPYPKGVGLIQEFLQNADDAGARSLRVFLDDRSYQATALPAASMAALQGPALVGHQRCALYGK